MKLKIVKSHLPAKKYDAIFTDDDGSFGGHLPA